MQDIPGPQSRDQVVLTSDVFLSHTLQKYRVSLLSWDVQRYVRSRITDKQRQDRQVTLMWGSWFRALLSCPPLNTPPHGARSLQGGRTYLPGHHSPGTHVPIIPCPKWSKASLWGLCGSSPSQGQAPRTEGWPWAASYWAMEVNKTWVSRLACLHTFL